MITNRLISYAQNREDIILQGFFDPNEIGFYVDIGGYDPDEDSVTKHFYIHSWRGINVEPQPDRFKLFVKKRPKDINLNVGVSNKQGELTLRSYVNQGLSTFSKEIQLEYEHDKSQGTEEYKDIKVKIITLKELFAKQKVQSIQFLKIDVEGLEYEVLEGNDWSEHRPEVICVEANHISRDWQKLLRSKDYSLVFFDGINEYYADNKTDRAEKFDYVEDVIFKEPIVNYKQLEDFDRYDKHIAWLESTIETLREDNELASANLHILNNELNSITPLRRHVKRQARHSIVKLDRKLVSKLSGKTKYEPVSQETGINHKDRAALLNEAESYDKTNFEQYAKATKPHVLLSPYLVARNTTHTSLRKIKHKIKGPSK